MSASPIGPSDAPVPDGEAASRPPSGMGQRQEGLSVAWRKPLAIIGLVLIAMWTIAAVAAPFVAPFDPLAQDSPRFLEPGGPHLFGTDELGRDVLSRVIYGSRVSLPLAVMLVLIAGTVGSVLGAAAGFVGGRVDNIIMRIADLVFAFPKIILAMVIVAILGPGLINAVLAIAFVAWPSYARVVRSLVISAREADYVNSARLIGLGPVAIVRQEVVPNVAGPVLVLGTLELGNAVLILAGLSFLGLGAQPPTPEWGSMVAFGARAFDRWWLGMFPGLAILSVVLAFNFVGDSLRDALDPRAAKNVKGDA